MATCALLCATVGAAQATTIDFEDLTSSSWGQIPKDYAGLQWPVDTSIGGSWTYWDVPSWFEVASGIKLAYWNGAGEAWIKFGQKVTFKGSWVDHDPYNLGDEAWWEGYRNGVKIYESEHYTSEVGKFISVNWPGIDAVQLKYTVPWRVIIDDLTFELATNQPPVAAAGPDQTAECSGAGGTAVQLDGSASNDPDGDPLIYNWYEGGTLIATGKIATVVLSSGTHPITLNVSDGNGGADTDEVNIRVVDTTPPIIDGLMVDKPVLWPPNHKMEEVKLSYTVSDACVEDVTVSVFVFCNETGQRARKRAAAIDWIVADDHSVSLRAEREAGGGGRVYTIVVIASDAAGNLATDEVTVTVPLRR